jgi:hypothetical protein
LSGFERNKVEVGGATITSLLVLDPYFQGKKPRGDYGTVSAEGGLDDGAAITGLLLLYPYF